MKPTKATLISWTENPLETIYSVWKASRGNGPVIDPKSLKVERQVNPALNTEVIELFKSIMATQIPVIESLHFTFIIENMSISLREQLVRHRIGTTVGPNVGVDIIPNLGSSSFWSQTMRVRNVGNFLEDGDFRMPEGMSAFQKEQYLECLRNVQDTYNGLIADGVPVETARELLPMALKHRTSWTLSGTSLMHVVGKRSCWIAQSDLWFPLIASMVDELVQKVDSIFLNLANPPCIKNDKFAGCKFHTEAENRCGPTPSDVLPPCPLYLFHEKGQDEMSEHLNFYIKDSRWIQFKKMVKAYKHFWKRVAYTGEVLDGLFNKR